MNSMNRKIISTLEAQDSRVKTTFLQFDNYFISGGSDAFSNAYELGDDVKSITICGFESGSSGDDYSAILELWVGFEDQSSAFLSPQGIGYFDQGLLYFGQAFIDAKWIKIRIKNDHPTGRNYSVRYYLST
jgi:hypothetical protein